MSAVWGQVDAVPAMFVLWTLLLLYTGPQSLKREIAALLIFAVAIAMKPQEGFVLPVMLYALYRRYLHRQPAGGVFDGALSIAISGALSLGLWAVSGLAFGLGPVGLVHFYSKSASVYPYTSANAFNLWGAVGFWQPDKAPVARDRRSGLEARGHSRRSISAGSCSPPAPRSCSGRRTARSSAARTRRAPTWSRRPPSACSRTSC